MSFHSKSFRFAVITVGLLAGAAAATLARLSRAPDGVIRERVHIAGIDCGNRPVDAVRADLAAWRAARLTEKVTLALPADLHIKKAWTPLRRELGADVDVERTLAGAMAVGQNETVFDRLSAWIAGNKTVDVPPVWTIDAPTLGRFLKKKVAPKVQRNPKNARFLALDTGFQIVPEQPGISLDQAAAAALISDRIRDVSDELIELPVARTVPTVTSADLKGIEGEVTHFRTHYTERGNRARNIITACDRINGTVLRSGDRFSYNKVVGPREEEAGFRLAPVIIKGRLVPGMGGGVCQVSTTLYNAALLADLKIVHREHHAFPVHYVPPGRDATVAYGSIDLQFENNTDGPIAIAASGKGQKVEMRIFGKPAANRQVNIERTNLSSWGAGLEVTRDSSLPAGKRVVVDKGHAGHRVTVWRTVKVDGKIVRREQMSRDYYHAFPQIVTVGPAVPIAPKVMPTASPPAPLPLQPVIKDSARTNLQ